MIYGLVKKKNFQTSTPYTLVCIPMMSSIHPDLIFIVEKYILSYTTDVDYNSTVAIYEGLELSADTDALTPFTNYSFTVSACTSGGCLSSLPVWRITQQAAPSGQGEPEVTALSADSFFIEWDPPTNPNGQSSKHVL